MSSTHERPCTQKVTEAVHICTRSVQDWPITIIMHDGGAHGALSLAENLMGPNFFLKKRNQGRRAISSEVARESNVG